MGFEVGVCFRFRVVVRLRVRVGVRIEFRVKVRVGLTVRVGSRCEGSINYSVSIPSNIYYLMIRPYASLFHHCINENVKSISGKDQMLICQKEFVLTDY